MTSPEQSSPWKRRYEKTKRVADKVALGIGLVSVAAFIGGYETWDNQGGRVTNDHLTHKGEGAVHQVEDFVGSTYDKASHVFHIPSADDGKKGGVDFYVDDDIKYEAPKK